MFIRRMTGADLSLLRPLAEASLAGEEALLRIGRSGFALGYIPLPRAQWRLFPPVAGFDMAGLAEDGAGALFAAFDDETHVGHCGVRATPEGWGDVLDIRVDAAHRRQGFGRGLLESCEEWCRGRGLHGLRVACTDTNPVMCQFLEHCGFTLRGMDGMALRYTDSERDKPLARRAALLFFYRSMKG